MKGLSTSNTNYVILAVLTGMLLAGFALGSVVTLFFVGFW